MRIVIDLQATQCRSPSEALDRQDVQLTRAIAEAAEAHEVWLALNGANTESTNSLRGAFQQCIPQRQIRVWHPFGAIHASDPRNTWRRRAAEITRETLLSTLQPDYVVITDIFRGWSDSTATSIGEVNADIPTAVIVDERTQPLFRKYLTDSRLEEWRQRKIGHLQRAELLLASSEETRQALAQRLGFDLDAVVNIGTGDADNPQSNDTRDNLLQSRYPIVRPFILTSVCSIRGLEEARGLINAYASLPEAIRAPRQLVLIHSSGETDIGGLVAAFAAEHHLAPNDIVIAEQTSQAEASALCRYCDVFVALKSDEMVSSYTKEVTSHGRPVIEAQVPEHVPSLDHCDSLCVATGSVPLADKLLGILTSVTPAEAVTHGGAKQVPLLAIEGVARRVLNALESRVPSARRIPLQQRLPYRPSLAYVSFQRGNIGDNSRWSGASASALTRHYEVDIVTPQGDVSDPWMKANCRLFSIRQFKNNFGKYDRVLYETTDAKFDQDFFNLLKSFPGVVDLREYNTSLRMLEHGLSESDLAHWTAELYRSHGYEAVRQRYHYSDLQDVAQRYPANFQIFQSARGVLVHSKHERQLTQTLYGAEAAKKLASIPQAIRACKPSSTERAAARELLGLDPLAFVVCDLTADAKWQRRLLEAWLDSNLAQRRDCILVVACGDEPGKTPLSGIRGLADCDDRVRLVADRHNEFLKIADVAIDFSRRADGRSSSVLECMGRGMSVIVGDETTDTLSLPTDSIWSFSSSADATPIIKLVERLQSNPRMREERAARATEFVLSQHSPRRCADHCAMAIETFYEPIPDRRTAIEKIGRLEDASVHVSELPKLASALVRTLPTLAPARQILFDVSGMREDRRSGILRVQRGFFDQLIERPPAGYRMEPVYFAGDRDAWRLRYARKHSLALLGYPVDEVDDELVDTGPDDIFIGPDLSLRPEAVPRLDAMHCDGVGIFFIVHDLLPIQMPHAFKPATVARYERWLNHITKYDGAICVSQTVARELDDWVSVHRSERKQEGFQIGWNHLGADFSRAISSGKLPVGADRTLESLSETPTFLMVGTLEPRKGHEFALAAFERLWATGVGVNLVIVGRQGWDGSPSQHAMPISELAQRLRDHPQHGRRLFWLEGINDEYLLQLYSRCSALVFASEGEGFGLPLIEAAQHKLPIIARDIPVFREVAGECAYFFSGQEPEKLSRAIKDWLVLYQSHQHPKSDNMKWQSWAESAQQLTSLIFSWREGRKK